MILTKSVKQQNSFTASSFFIIEKLTVLVKYTVSHTDETIPIDLPTLKKFYRFLKYIVLRPVFTNK
jgi:hypothetical protein